MRIFHRWLTVLMINKVWQGADALHQFFSRSTMVSIPYYLQQNSEYVDTTGMDLYHVH